jgi:hypothetical protein
MKTLTTNSLFYGKYPYKITCRVPGGRWRNKFTKNYWYPETNSEDEKNGADFYKVSEKYYQDKSIKIRTEHSLTSFYFKDESFIETMKTELKRWIREIHQPASSLDQEFLLNNPKKVVCDFYPKKKYRYCVYIKNTMPASKRQSFYDWFVKNNNDNMSITGSTQRWLQQRKNYGEFYIRVEDEKTLLLVNMFLSEYITKTVEYVLRNSINIEVGTV